MSREIKFRGKRIDNGEWVYGYYADEYGASGIFVSGTDEHPNLVWHDVDEETVGQYTGLKDKNGKEIYEGDKVQIGNFKVQPSVFWDEQKAAFYTTTLEGCISPRMLSAFAWEIHNITEIIGTIHDKENSK